MTTIAFIILGVIALFGVLALVAHLLNRKLPQIPD